MKTKNRTKKMLKIALIVLGVISLCFMLSTCIAVVLTSDEEVVVVEVTVAPTVPLVVTTAYNATNEAKILVTSTSQPTDTPVPTPTNTPEPTLPPPTPTVGWIAMDILQSAWVVEVVDGDTIKVEIDGEVFTVRYIGIDTPETVHPSKPVEWMGAEASAVNESLVGGQQVLLERDVSETDRYGRLLRYVHLMDGTFVNAELVRLGYAQVSTYPPDVYYQDLFLIKQQEAVGAERGLWSIAPTEVPAVPTEPSQVAPVCDCSGNIYNCPDFTTRAQAQACHNYCIEVTGWDIHKLDGNDNDGLACESLP